MRLTSVLILTVLASCSAHADDARSAAAKQLTGTWQLRRALLGGSALPEPMVNAIRLELKDGKYLMTGAESPDRGSWKVLGTKAPFGLDISGTDGPTKGKTLHAIFAVDGDGLKVCYGMDGKTRPTAFGSKSGSALFLAEYQRVKSDKEGFFELFNGKDLDGWKASENPGTFRVEDGCLVVNGPRAHLFYMGPTRNYNFKNFHLRAEVMTLPKSNSGIYFHTTFQAGGWPDQGFECQVNETHGDVKKTGGLYDVKEVLNQSPAKNNEWYVYEVIVMDKRVVLKIDGKVTCDWTQPDDWKSPPGHGARVIGAGTIAIQGHDPGSKALYRSIKIKPLD